MPDIDGIKYSFITDRLIVLLAYTLAIFGAWVSLQFFPDHELWIKIAIADFTGTVIIFISSRLLKNSSVYDPYWSMAPIIILFYLVFINGIPLFYLRFIVPFIGGLLSGKWKAYKYLESSIRNFVSKREIENIIRASGFEDIQIKQLHFGIVTIFIAK